MAVTGANGTLSRALADGTDFEKPCTTDRTADPGAEAPAGGSVTVHVAPLGPNPPKDCAAYAKLPPGSYKVFVYNGDAYDVDLVNDTAKARKVSYDGGRNFEPLNCLGERIYKEPNAYQDPSVVEASATDSSTDDSDASFDPRCIPIGSLIVDQDGYSVEPDGSGAGPVPFSLPSGLSSNATDEAAAICITNLAHAVNNDPDSPLNLDAGNQALLRIT